VVLIKIDAVGQIFKVKLGEAQGETADTYYQVNYHRSFSG
jgi:hypothetical protein